MTEAEWDHMIANSADEELLAHIYSLPDEDVIEYCWWADGEICNGGFRQYYSNSIFDALKHASYLEELGEQQMAEIVKKSLLLFPNGEQPKRLESEEPIFNRVDTLLGGNKSAFEDLEDQYYASNGGFESSCAAYVRKHPDHYYQLCGKKSAY